MIQQNDIIVFQGDSITDSARLKNNPIANDIHGLGCGYAGKAASTLLADRLDWNLAIHNRGISGDRITDLRKRWQADTLDLRPSLLSILIGVNDTWHGVASGTPSNGTDLETFAKVYRELLAMTRDVLPKTRIVICEPFTTRAGAVLEMDFFPDIDDRRAIVAEVAHESGLCFVPFQQLFDGLSPRTTPEYWAADGVHPTPQGHEMMARFWLDHVKKSQE